MEESEMSELGVAWTIAAFMIAIGIGFLLAAKQ